MAVTTQVRAYTVEESLIDEWARRWKEEIVPLRLEFDFSLSGAWIDREHHHSIWEISYEGPETFAEHNRRYWDSPKREAMSLDPEEYLVSTETREVTRGY